MTQSIVQDRTARRTVKALGICDRQEVIPSETQDGYFYVTDSGTGSGKTYLASSATCTCPDSQYRGNRCKHQIAAGKEFLALRQFAANWDMCAGDAAQAVKDAAYTAELNARAAVTPISAEQGQMTTEDAEWLADDVDRDEYSGPYGSDGWQQPRPCCPTCGAELESRQYFVGGKGYCYFNICTRDAEHQALPA